MPQSSINQISLYQQVHEAYEKLLAQPNKAENTNGVYLRYQFPVLTSRHTPPFWRYDCDPQTGSFFQETQGINAAFNAGAIYFEGKYIVVARVEGVDRKSFFAVAESPNGIDQFRFWDEPILMPENEVPDTNIYDMRLTAHEDGWIYGLFCTERRDPKALPSDQSAAIAQCGIARTRDLVQWERLPDLVTNGSQQRNVVLHPEFIQGKYALYTRPQDGFIDAGSGGGIGWALCDTMENAVVTDEAIVDPKVYHTINEVKNGQGPAPIKTEKGWLHLAHGVRNTAAGLRYVLYLLLTDLEKPWLVIKKPAGYFMAPEGEERVGDVSNVLFCNGWIRDAHDDVYIYYASSDTRLHVATSTVSRLLQYVENAPEDGLTSYASVQTRLELIRRNKAWLKQNNLL